MIELLRLHLPNGDQRIVSIVKTPIKEADMDDPLKQAKSKAAATYDAAADHFDDEPLSFWERIGRSTVARLDLPAGSNVLDVGCRTGASALPAAQAVGPDGSVLAV
jgi:ubiquinone/menaquinone biosynthesis C-methylase UbiE